MQITKFIKKSGSKYNVYFSNGTYLTIHEDVILKYNLLLNKELNIDELDNIEKDNNRYLVYDMALKYINIKLRCEREIKEYLKKKNIEEELINNTVEKLKKDGYLDSKLYIKSYIQDKINLNNLGPNKIKKDLMTLGFNANDIDDELNKIDNDEVYIKLNRLIDKKISQIKNYSGLILKKKIIDYFIDKGYNKEDIERILNSKDLTNKDQYKKEYDKLYNKYSKKYTGDELERFIKNKLYQKGFNK